MSYPGYPPQPQTYPPPQGYGGYPPPPQQQQFYGHGTPPPQGYPPPTQPPPQQYPPPQGYPQPQPPPPPVSGYPQQYAPPNYGPPQGPSGPPPHQPSFPPQHQNSFPPPQPQPSFPPTYHHTPSFPPPQHTPTFPAPPPAYTAQPAPYGGPAPAPPPPLPNVSSEVFAIQKAMRGFGTDERTLIQIFGSRDGATIDAIRQGYTAAHGDLIKALHKETSGNFRLALISTALGPGAEGLAFWVHKAVAGAGTNEAMLTEALMCRTNAEIADMKVAYRRAYNGQSMESDVKGDLSFKTKELFNMVMEGQRTEDWINPDPAQARREAEQIYSATKGRLGTDEMTVCRILTRSNEAQLRAVAYEYSRLHGHPLDQVIRTEFSGHMKDALLYIVNGASDHHKRDAELLEAAMKGFGTKDELLILRVVRCHWNRIRMESVKNRYFTLYGRTLADRIRGETSGHYRDLLLALVG